MLAASVAALNHRTRGHDRAQALQEVFARYDKDASGSIHYHEFVSLANQAFEQVNANASHPLNGSHVGKCSVHGPSQAFRVDGFCIDCELGAMEHQSELLPPVPVRRGIEGATAQLNGGALPFADDAPSAKSWLLAHAASTHQVVVDRDEARRKLKASSAQSAGKSMTKGWASAASVAAAKSAYVCVCGCVCVCVCVCGPWGVLCVRVAVCLCMFVAVWSRLRSSQCCGCNAVVGLLLLSAEKHQQEVAQRLMDGGRSTIPKLRVIAVAMRARKMLKNRLLAVRARKQCVPVLWKAVCVCGRVCGRVCGCVWLAVLLVITLLLVPLPGAAVSNRWWTALNLQRKPRQRLTTTWTVARVHRRVGVEGSTGQRRPPLSFNRSVERSSTSLAMLS